MRKVGLLLVAIILINICNAQTELWGPAPFGGQTNSYTGTGGGALYTLDSNATNFADQYVFPQMDAYAPYNGELLEAQDGMMYGCARRLAGWSMLVIFQYDYHKNVFVERYSSPNGSRLIDGNEPIGSLVQLNNGLMYGLMNQGGANDFGTIFTFDPVTNQFTKKVDFGNSVGTYPSGSLFEAANGKLYGLARAGGLYNYGTMYEYDPITNIVIPLIHFDGNNVNIGETPIGSMTQGSDGLLYGTTSKGGTLGHGIVFSYDLSTNTFTKRKDFGATNGAYPCGALKEGGDGNFYGLTTGSTTVWPCSGGSIFQFNPSLNSIITKYSFNLTGGTNPFGSLRMGTDGNFYGLTTNTLGGKTGSLFQYDYWSNVFTSKYNFDAYDYGGTPSGTLFQASNGKFYGTTRDGGSKRSGGQVVDMGTLFEYDPSIDLYEKKFDFGTSYNGIIGKVIYSKGTIYGTTEDGGIYDDGTIFQYEPGSREYTKLFDYNGTTSGLYPQGITKLNDSTFYVVCNAGGSNGKGTILKFNPINRTFIKMLDIAVGNSGENPFNPMLLASDGMLYGCTHAGGTNSSGVLYQYNPTTNVYTNKFNFSYTISGSNSTGTLIQASNGKLYGLLENGGLNTYGTLFQFDIVTNVFAKKYDFNTSTGKIPKGSLMQANNGKIYGFTSQGGTNNMGVLFQYDLSTNIYTKKIDFDGVNLGNPFSFGSLIQPANGHIFGTTSDGGLSNVGVVFKYDTVSNVLTKTYDFAVATGARPTINSLVEVPILPSAQVTTTISSNICKSDSVVLSYLASGTFNSGNVFDIEMSNAYGYFLTPVVVATTTSNISGTVTATFPTYVADGTGYKLRIRSSDPYTVSYPTTGSISLSKPSLTLTSSTSSLCVGSSATLTVIGASSYSWNTTATTASIAIIPTTTATYTVTGADLNNCSSTETISVIVDNTCADVWPGDANSDGVANNLDVLELGLHYTQGGVPRGISSNNWQSYFANNWAGTITTGKNLNHSDCNGDGLIDDNDTLAIYYNYSLTHAFKPAQTTTVNTQLSIVPDQATVTKGSWGTASIYLGDAINTITNINGVAFTIDFDYTLIEPYSIYIEYHNSFIDASQNLHFQRPEFSSGKIFAATTHTVSNNVSGYGKIGTLHYQILSSLVTDEVLTISISQANQSDANGTITPLTSGANTLMAIGASVGVNNVTASGNVMISPNPADGILNISMNSIPQNTKIEISNSIGALVATEMLSNKNTTINISDLSSGMYFVKLLEGSKVIAVKKIVKQ